MFLVTNSVHIISELPNLLDPQRDTDGGCVHFDAGFLPQKCYVSANLVNTQNEQIPNPCLAPWLEWHYKFPS